MKKDNIGVFFILATVAVVLLLCDIATPWLYRHVETDHYRTILMLDKLKESGFKPDLMVFGSSKSMSGIDAYQMTEELGIDCYNFSSSNQSPAEGSLFFSELPDSLKTLIMVIFPPVRNVCEERTRNVLPVNVSTAFVFGGYKLKDEIKILNKNIDLSGLEKNRLLLNMDARGSIVIPGLYNYFRPKMEEGTMDFKYPYSYSEERLTGYDQTVAALRKVTHVGKDIEWDNDIIEELILYHHYLKNKGINMMIAMLPTNPDIKEFSYEQLAWIDKNFSSQFPGIATFNYLSVETNRTMYFDGTHLNRTGGKYVTHLLNNDLLDYFNNNN